MSNPTRSLNAHVPHRRLLNLLGCTVRTHSLPQLAICPICRKGGMQIHHDHIDNGAWYSCRACNRHGDLIELAVATWKLDLRQSITQLARKGFDLPTDKESIQRYQREHVDYRQRLEKLWEEAQRGLIHQSPTLMQVMDRMGLTWSESLGRWQAGPGRIIGGLPKTDIEKSFAPAVMKNAEARRQRYNPSAHAVFRGKEWGDVLMVPFYDLPGRISCLLCVGRQGDPEQDYVIKRANRGGRGNQHVQEPFEAGLAFHPDLFDEAAYHDRTVLAIGDPVTALQLQVRHFSLSSRPLPIVSWLDSARHPNWQSGGRRTRTHHAWQMLAGYRVVFWMPRFDLNTVRQAIAVDGLISTVGPREPGEQSLREYCWKMVPAELFQHIQDHAQPWQDVLSVELAKQSDAGIEQLLVELEHEGEDVEAILKRCHSTVQTRAAELRNFSEQPRSVQLNGRRIVETNDEWHVFSKKHRSSELIVNAVLRIDAAVKHRRAGQFYYRGRILFEGQVVRFFEPMGPIDKNPLEWMREFLLRQGVGIVIFSPGWKNRIIGIARMFHEPVIDSAVDTVGWDGEANKFVLPNFAIRVGGHVESIDWPLFPENVPSRELEQPETLSGEELARPSENREMESLFWATAGCIITNIIAPAFDEGTRGICLEGRGTIGVGQEVAEAMGCLPVLVQRARDLERAFDDEYAHGVPVVFEVGYQLQRRHRRELLKQRDEWRNCVVGVDWYNSRVLALRGGWNVVTGQCRGKVPLDVIVTAKKLLPAYLKRLCQRGLALIEWKDEPEAFVERVIRDLARFSDEHHGDAGAVLSAHDSLLADRDGEHPQVVADLLRRLIQEGLLKIAAKPDGRGKPTLVEVAEHDALLLTHDDFEKSLQDALVDLPRAAVLADTLLLAGALVVYREDQYLFRRKWLEKRWQRVASVESGMVRLHG